MHDFAHTLVAVRLHVQGVQCILTQKQEHRHFYKFSPIRLEYYHLHDNGTLSLLPLFQSIRCCPSQIYRTNTYQSNFTQRNRPSMTVDALSRLLDVILDDLSARFIINLPEEELSSVTRICFGLEQAHWFYEDFFRPQHPTLPSVNLRAFTTALFSHCPLLWKFSGQHEAAFDDFLKYKTRVPVRGVIMLNDDMDKVRQTRSASSFQRLTVSVFS